MPYRASNDSASPRLARSMASASVRPGTSVFFACVNSPFQAALDVMRLSSCSLYGLHAKRQTQVHIWDGFPGNAAGLRSSFRRHVRVSLPLCRKQLPGTSGPYSRTPVVELSFPECGIYLDSIRREATHLEVASGNSGSTPHLPLIHPARSWNLGPQLERFCIAAPP
jgi:hypothetical protein